MKKFKLKFILSILLMSICLSLGTSLPSNASEIQPKDNNQFLYDIYSGRQLQSVISVENGVSKKLTQEEYNEILMKREIIENKKKTMLMENKDSTLETSEQNEIQPLSYWVDYSFDKWGEDDWHPRSMTMRVSPRTYARYLPTDMGYTDQNSVTVSIGGSFGAGATIKKIITAELTIDYSNSTEKSKSYEIGVQVPVGYTGWVEFTPRMANIWGKLTRTEYSNYDQTETNSYSDSFFPTKVGTFADGIYEVVIQKGQIR